MTSSWKQGVKNKKHQALEHLEELENEGTEHGAHYDFNELINAIKKFERETGYHEKQKLFLQGVGDAQRKVPVHVANEYCRRDIDYFPREFDEKTLPRVLEFPKRKLSTRTTPSRGRLTRIKIEYEKNDASWFPLSPSSGLGFEFAMCRGKFDRAYALYEIPVSYITSEDIKAITKLRDMRIMELHEIKKQLLHSPPKKPGRS